MDKHFTIGYPELWPTMLKTVPKAFASYILVDNITNTYGLFKLCFSHANFR